MEHTRTVSIALTAVRVSAEPSPLHPPAPPYEPLRVCARCGQVGGLWAAEERSEIEVDLATLAANECVGATATGRGHVLYRHLCADRVSGREACHV